MTDASKAKRQAALVSLLAALCLTGTKLGIALWTNSLAMLSDAVHSGLDLVASGMTLLAVTLASKPADSDHSFGHGKFENFSALAQTLLLIFTSFFIAREAFERLSQDTPPVQPSLIAIGIMLLSIGIDINRVRVLKRVAREHRSQALEADALHFSTDILSSSVVLVGLALSWGARAIGVSPRMESLLSQADTVAALLVAGIIAFTGFRLAKKAFSILIDGIDPRLISEISNCVARVSGVLSVREIRIRQSGSQYFVHVTILVAPHLHVPEAHNITENVTEAVREALVDADVTVHVEPGEKQDKKA